MVYYGELSFSPKLEIISFHFMGDNMLIPSMSISSSSTSSYILGIHLTGTVQIMPEGAFGRPTITQDVIPKFDMYIQQPRFMRIQVDHDVYGNKVGDQFIYLICMLMTSCWSKITWI